MALAAQQQKPVLSTEAVQLSAEMTSNLAAKAAEVPTNQTAETKQQNATSNKSIPVYPDVAQVLDMKQNQLANSSITGAFTAGPNNPWNSRWVFGAQTPQTNSKQSELDLSALQQLGQLKKGSENADPNAQLEKIEQLGALNEELAKIQGQLEMLSLDEVPEEAGADRTKPQLKSLSGSEYLALQNLKNSSQEQTQQQTSDGAMSDSNREALKQMVKPSVEQSGAVTREFQLIPGGLSTKNKDTPKTQDLTMGIAPANWMNTNHQNLKPQTIELKGNVVPGGMMRDRLTTDTVHNLSNGIQSMKFAKGGEMSIKLNPAHLGELMIKVSTDGQAVGLKVHASDPKAKKILEESISSLKESLATQQLALGRVDISVTPTNQSQQSFLDANSQNSNSGYRSDMQQFDSRDSGQQRSSYAQAQEGYDVPQSRSSLVGSNAGRAARTASNGRVDLMA